MQTQETINQRVKRLRKELKLTQSEFSKTIAISSGQLACIETEKRVVNDRTVKLICDSFGVNSVWLKAGEGEKFNGDKDSRYARLITLYDNLKPEYQDYILRSMNYFLRNQDIAL
ncbi:MAG: helix-turn-helix domain-containing protein [Spirochaetia bacterium]|jgi:transcriptional regulator with XRE-family HTH domain|nr:helix-turn-helix domain-containing protein [Spirochaetia bacterium]